MNPQKQVGTSRHGRLFGVIATTFIALILGGLSIVVAPSTANAAAPVQASAASAAVHAPASGQVRAGVSFVSAGGTHGRIVWEGPCTCGEHAKPVKHRKHHGHKARHPRRHRHHHRHPVRPPRHHHVIKTLYPVPPTITQPKCTGPGMSSPGSAVSAVTPGVPYKFVNSLGQTLDATNLPDGDVWVVASAPGKYTRLGDANGFVNGRLKVNIVDAGACLVVVTPTPVTVTHNPTCKPASARYLTGSVADQSPGIINTVTDLQTGAVRTGVAGSALTFAVPPGHSKRVTQTAALGYIFPSGMAQVQSTYTNTLNPKTMCPKPPKHHRHHGHRVHRQHHVKKPATCYRRVVVLVPCKGKCH